MHEKQVKSLKPIKLAAAYGGGFGFIFLLFGIIESDFNLLVGLGVGLTASSVVLFLFGVFLSILDEYSLSGQRTGSTAQPSPQFYYWINENSASARLVKYPSR
ncbi:hypothetical protein [Neobacillus cucumis]|uniref:hypothetical protein n=1 Tax=Neobacillus cucumis TaxID=1740721 RepID=UPI0028533B40|nr:hypothetical protein [Neobacillus cucumis]MDR4944983.1 hypothetical protein [Neobacillus cucumis]